MVYINNKADFQFLWLSEFLKKPIYQGKIGKKIGKPSDIVFKLDKPYPKAAGIYIYHGWGNPTEFIAWDQIAKIDDDAIFLKAAQTPYPAYQEKPGFVMAREDLLGRTILDMDGRRVEVINDLHLLESQGQMIIAHIDISFNGFLRKWGLKWLSWSPNQLISWKFVKFFSTQEAAASDAVSLSITRKDIASLPSEDLANALEVLEGKEQLAFFSVLSSEQAAETLTTVEPRVQRQLMPQLRKDKTRMILSEMSVPQMANLLSALPNEEKEKILRILSEEEAGRIRRILSERDLTASMLMCADYVSFRDDVTVGEVLQKIRSSKYDSHTISYIYVTNEENILVGVADLRELIISDDKENISDIMSSPVIVAEDSAYAEDLAKLFAKYHFHALPVVDAKDKILGIVRYKDIMQSTDFEEN